MSDAPERIWAWAWEVDRHRGQWSEVQEIVGEGDEYVRADLHAAAIARAERAEQERDRFEAALGRACLVGGTTYLLERAKRAEAALAVAEEALMEAEGSFEAIFDCSPARGPSAVAENARNRVQAFLAKIVALKGGAQ